MIKWIAYYKIPLANKNEIKQLKYLGFIVIIFITIYSQCLYVPLTKGRN